MCMVKGFSFCQSSFVCLLDRKSRDKTDVGIRSWSLKEFVEIVNC